MHVISSNLTLFRTIQIIYVGHLWMPTQDMLENEVKKYG